MCGYDLAKVFTSSEFAINKILIDNAWSGRGTHLMCGGRTVHIRGSCQKYFPRIEPGTTVSTRIALRLPVEGYLLSCLSKRLFYGAACSQIHKSIRSLSLLLFAPANLKSVPLIPRHPLESNICVSACCGFCSDALSFGGNPRSERSVASMHSAGQC